ncbi:MAG: hypothetical protein WCI53_11125 [Bacteroidota bacterium]|jgi:hypothetical protein
MTDKELDNLINNKIVQQQFEYKEAYWESAAALINIERQQIKKLVWYKRSFYSASILLFVLMGWFLISNNKKLELVEEKGILQNKLISENKLSTEDKSNELVPTSKPETEYKNNNEIIESSTKLPNVKTIKVKAKSKNLIRNLDENISQTENIEIVTSPSNNEILINGLGLNFIENKLTNPIFNYTKVNSISKPVVAIKSSKLTSFNASLETGINTFNNIFDDKSIGYYVGGRLYFDIGKFSFNSNLHFENINQNLPARTIVNKNYDFNSNTNITEIKNQSIDYAILGLNLMYPIYRNNSIGFGIQYAFLLQSNDLFTEFNIEKNIKVSEKKNNYSSVLNAEDYQLSVNYQNRFSKHLAVNASYIFGLNKVSNLNNSNYNNQGLKLGIQYIIK